MDERLEVLARVARQMAAAQRKACSWVSQEELEQEAWVVGLQVLPRYDPQRGDLGGYLYRACQQAVSRWAWQQGGVLTHGTHRTGALAAEVLEWRGQSPVDPETISRRSEAPDALVEAAETERRVRAWAVRLVEEGGERGACVWEVLTGTPRQEAAAAHGLPLDRTLYDATYYARRALREEVLAEGEIL